jgi:hypothetical protein
MEVQQKSACSATEKADASLVLSITLKITYRERFLTEFILSMAEGFEMTGV